MRLGDAAQAVDAGLVVEQHVAAAVDLGVDEAGHEVAALQVDRLRALGRRARQHGDDVAVFDDDADVFLETALGEHGAVVEGEGAGHGVTPSR